MAGQTCFGSPTAHREHDHEWLGWLAWWGSPRILLVTSDVCLCSTLAFASSVV